MHADLLKLSEDVIQLPASRSSHFVWIDEPQVIIAAIEQLMGDLSKQQSEKIRNKE
jgi:hypothetical protein